MFDYLPENAAVITCGDHHDAARKVTYAAFSKDAAIREEAAAPNPVDNWSIAQQHPEAGKQQNKAKAWSKHDNVTINIM